MALVTPIGVAIPAFDASQEQVFSFTVQGGDQVVGNILTIIDNDTSQVVYTNQVESYVYNQTLPAETLTNNKYYAFYFQTVNVVGDISNKSSNVTFRTFTQPTLSFTNIPSTGIIEAGSYNFTVAYNQIEGELLNSLYFYLYDVTQTELQVSNIYTSAATPPIYFEHQFNGLIDDERYYVRAIATTIYGTTVDTGMNMIDVNYSYEGAYFAVTATNNVQNGYVQISNNITEIDGEVYEGNEVVTPKFDDGNAIDLYHTQRLVWSDGFSFRNDVFAKQKWWTPVLFGRQTTISNLSSIDPSGDGNSYITIEFKRGTKNSVTKDYMIAKGYVDNIQYFTKISNLIEPLNNFSQVTSFLKVDNGNIEFDFSTVLGGDTLIWNGESDIEYGVIPQITWDDESASTYENVLEFDGYSNVEFNKITDMYWVAEEEAMEIEERDDLHAPPTIKYFSNVQLVNSIVRDFYLTHDASQESPYPSLPNWDNYTIMRANFDNNLVAGNVDWLLNSVTKIKVKRRKLGARETYVTLFEQPISTVYDLSFFYRDYYVPSGYEYEYAMVPCVGSNEQMYFTTTVTTQFDGLFVSDKDKSMKLYGNVMVNSSADNILIGALQPYNQVYPVIIKNPNVLYRTVTFQGDVLGISDNNCTGEPFKLTQATRPIIVNQKREWDKFLCNGKAKIIRDWNGNVILAKITTAPQYTYTQESGSSKPTMTFGVTEVGDYDNQWALYHHGLVDVEST